MNDNNIIQKTKFGILWNAFEKFGVQGISFVLNIILVRLLSPNDIGILALLVAFSSLANIFIEGGFVRALIQKKDCTEQDFSTTFIFNVVIGLFFYIVLFFAAPAISEFYKMPDLTTIQRVLFLSVILNAFCVVQIARFQMVVNFKALALINLVAVMISGILGIILAYNGFGVWSLIWQELTKNFLIFVSYWYFGGWIPKTWFSKSSFNRLFSYGSKLVGVGLIAVVVNAIYNTTIGKIYNTKDLGYYSQGEALPRGVFGALSSVVITTTFPLMSSLQDNKEELMKIFKRLVKIISLMTFPVMVGLAVVSKEFILILLTQKWLMAAELLFWFSLSYLFTPISGLNLNILNAIGRSDLFLKIEFAKLPIIFLTMAITFPIGLKAIVIGKFASSFLCFFINSYICYKKYEFGGVKQLWHIRKIIISTIIMACLMSVAKICVDDIMLRLICAVVVGFFSYILVLKILKEEELEFIMIKFKNKFQRK